MTDDLVRRLRECASEIARDGHAGWGNACTDAAAAIEALQAALEICADSDAPSSINVTVDGLAALLNRAEAAERCTKALIKAIDTYSIELLNRHALFITEALAEACEAARKGK